MSAPVQTEIPMVKSEPLVAGKRLLSRAEFCERYGVGHTKFYELLNAGAFKGVKNGTRLFISTDEAERWAASLPTFKPLRGARRQ
jgi:hypothetical protein